MTDHWDEFSKSLAKKSVPRRQSLRLLGAALAGALLGSLGVKSASATGRDPCKAFCRCRNKSQQSACLAACSACGGDTNRLCGACGSYTCCAEPGPNEYGACIDGRCEYWCADGAGDCGGICTFLNNDPDNCGACGNVCPEWAPYCSWGQCWDAGCGGADLMWDSSNCGVCGHVCPWGTACSFGVCGSGGGDGGF